MQTCCAWYTDERCEDGEKVLRIESVCCGVAEQAGAAVAGQRADVWPALGHCAGRDQLAAHALVRTGERAGGVHFSSDGAAAGLSCMAAYSLYHETITT